LISQVEYAPVEPDHRWSRRGLPRCSVCPMLVLNVMLPLACIPLVWADRALDLAYFPVENLNLIFPVLASLATFPGVAGQRLMIFLVDVSTTGCGLESVPPCVVWRFSWIFHLQIAANPAAQPLASRSASLAISVGRQIGKERTILRELCDVLQKALLYDGGMQWYLSL